MTLRIVDQGSPFIFEVADESDTEDEIQIPGYSLGRPYPNSCLICGKLGSGDELQDRDSRSRQNLKTLCETLQPLNTDFILEKIEHDPMRSQIQFCKDCRQNLEAYEDLQIQLLDLNLRLGGLRDLLSNAFLQDSSDAILPTLPEEKELRNFILTEYWNPERRNERTTVLANPIAFMPDEEHNFDDSYPYHEDNYPDDEWTPPAKKVSSSIKTLASTRLRRHPKPTSNQFQNHNTKPCQVSLIRMDEERTIETKITRRERKTRLRRLMEKLGKGTETNPRPSKRRRLSPSKWNVKIESIKSDSEAERPTKWRRKVIPCPFGNSCPELFRSEKFVEYHIKQVHEGNQKPFNCLACPAEFEELEGLQGHIKTGHAKIAECPTCQKQLRNGYDSLAYHFRRQGGVCSLDPLPLNSTIDPSNQDPKKFVCGVCSRRFKRREILVIHVHAAHSEGSPFICEFCCKPFKREKGIEFHQRRHHPKEYMDSFNIDEETYMKEVKGRQCNTCNKIFASSRAKLLHEARHRNQYKFQCEKCGAGCSSKFHLTNHLLTHSTEKQHGCPHCPIRFKRIDKLKRHLITIHSIGGKTKECACEFCPKLFWDNFALQRHKKLMHRDVLPEEEKPEEYRCDLCGYTCVDKWYLRIHNKSRGHKAKAGLPEVHVIP